MTQSQRVLYEARACGFEDELTTVEGSGRSAGGDDFGGFNVDPVGAQNTNLAWMVLVVNLKLCNVETDGTKRGEISNHSIQAKGN